MTRTSLPKRKIRGRAMKAKPLTPSSRITLPKGSKAAPPPRPPLSLSKGLIDQRRGERGGKANPSGLARGLRGNAPGQLKKSANLRGQERFAGGRGPAAGPKKVNMTAKEIVATSRLRLGKVPGPNPPAFARDVANNFGRGVAAVGSALDKALPSRQASSSVVGGALRNAPRARAVLGKYR